MPHKRTAATRDVVLIGVAIVLLAGAVGLYFSLQQPEGAPTDQFVGFHCPDCDHHFQLSHRDVEQTIWERRDFEKDDTGKMLIRCPQCEQYKAGRATRRGGRTAPDLTDPG